MLIALQVILLVLWFTVLPSIPALLVFAPAFVLLDILIVVACWAAWSDHKR